MRSRVFAFLFLGLVATQVLLYLYWNGLFPFFVAAT